MKTGAYWRGKSTLAGGLSQILCKVQTAVKQEQF